ncbi:MAG: NAD(P)H-quinone oxidoreductase [Truepera sp.]|nr:NAD(P)H-quinone oxidoreductase [Truepera sp.]
MKAIIVEPNPPDYALRWAEVAAPTPQDGEVLVEVHATAVNRADLAQRAGHYPPPPGASEVLGLELAGVIAAVTPGVTGWQVGDRVCALLSGGGYAEQAAVPQGLLMPIPKGWSLTQAAAMPEVFFTAFLNLFLEARLKPGETVLIHGGASGVGTAAIQLARQAGCRVLATAGSAAKVAACYRLGAELAVNYREADFGEAIAEQVGGVDVVLDMVGSGYLARNIRLLNTGGRLIFIATLGGSRAEIDIRELMRKRLLLKGSTLRARPLAEKIALKEAFMARCWPAIESGEVVPVIDRVLPIAEAEAAHALLQRNETIGKVVLEIKTL